MSLQIQNIQPQQLNAVENVHQQAFPEPGEARLVRLLHERHQAPVSLAAALDTHLVGHVLFSPVTFDPPQPHIRAVGLAPVAVLPEHQRQGIGSQLIRCGLQQCRDAGFDAVVVLGNPAYYSRFGFTRARDYGLGNDYQVDAEFMALELKLGALNGVRAIVKYQPEFQEADC
ncbi:MAG TPA: N-acetyltransferase [Anaerolineae bacterium]|nr:N-acetyltransferase [Anaerolineae bacterium]